jgi:sulfite exporter TauE/SafE
MCGGLMVAAAGDKNGTAWYHLGRLSGYLTLGTLAGTIGSQVMLSDYSPLIAFIGSLLISVAFIALGLRTWLRGGLHLGFPAWLNRFASRLNILVLNRLAFGSVRGISLGVLSILLPCGWLYVFVLAAVSTQSTWRGAALLTAFWAGTLPLMSVAPTLIQKLLGKLSFKAPALSGALLIGIGILTLAQRFSHSEFQPNLALGIRHVLESPVCNNSQTPSRSE